MLPLNNKLESCWCQKLTERIKSISHSKFERKRIKEIFYGTLIFEQSSIISIGHYNGGHTSSCPPTWRPKLLFARILLERYLRSDVLKTLLNHLFHNFLGNSLFQKSHFGHVTSYELIHFNKMVRVWKTKNYYFVFKTYDPLIVFWTQNHITFIFIKVMSHDLLVQMAY